MAEMSFDGEHHRDTAFIGDDDRCETVSDTANVTPSMYHNLRYTR
ncbi:MAG: hypothetical protein OXB90_06760 [Acidimicrobiaceae bacterium]|nr:hypothetical protein [Acidimicrobiaceae bacterium]